MLSRFEQFTFSINEIDLYWHRIASAEMKKYGLKGSHAIYFTKLYGLPAGITAVELGVLCGKDKADVSREIKLLEKAGLVIRDTTAKRGYRALILLTEQGTEVARSITQKAELAVQLVTQSLSAREQLVFRKALDKIANNMRALSEAGLPEDPSSSNE